MIIIFQYACDSVMFYKLKAIYAIYLTFTWIISVVPGERLLQKKNTIGRH